METMQEIDITP